MPQEVRKNLGDGPETVLRRQEREPGRTGADFERAEGIRVKGHEKAVFQAKAGCQGRMGVLG